MPVLIFGTNATRKYRSGRCAPPTHGHKDHTGGLDELRAFNFKTRKALPVYADQKTWRM